MTLYEVEVFVDHDSVGIYLVRCDGENEALEIALEHVRDLTGGEVKEVNFPDKVDEFDYDGLLEGRERP